MSSGATAQDSAWKAKEQGDEARYAREKEQEQLAALRAKIGSDDATDRAVKQEAQAQRNRDEFEGGYGGQEDLEDRYATTSGEH